MPNCYTFPPKDVLRLEKNVSRVVGQNSLIYSLRRTDPITPLGNNNLNFRFARGQVVHLETTRNSQFRAPLCLCFKVSLSAKPFLWKWLWFAWKLNETACITHFHMNGFALRHRFETEAQENSEMAYLCTSRWNVSHYRDGIHYSRKGIYNRKNISD